MSDVFRDVISTLKEDEIKFICTEAEITEEELLQMTEEELDDIYDLLCDIEISEAGKEPEMSDRGRMASEIVSVMGDAIAEQEGYYD